MVDKVYALGPALTMASPSASSTSSYTDPRIQIALDIVNWDVLAFSHTNSIKWTLLIGVNTRLEATTSSVSSIFMTRLIRLSLLVYPSDPRKK
jgi:hypothetical protein